MADTVYLNYTQRELDTAYDQRAWAPNAMDVMAGWREAVPHREAWGWQELPYGASERQRLDIFPASSDLKDDLPGPKSSSPELSSPELPSPVPGVVHFHVHGGAWCRMAKEDATFIVPAQQSIGLTSVIPDFDLLPGVTLTEQFAQLRKAFVKTVQVIGDYGGDPQRIIVSGHSSGAHLAALLAATDMREYGLRADVIKSLLLISGPFDLDPVLLSARREYIHLSADAANELNPYRLAEHIHCQCQLLYGEHESPEFIRQSVAMTEQLQSLGKAASCEMVEGVNHFEIMGGFGDVNSPVFQALKRAVASVV